jgi:hypothetical protein
MLGCSRWKYYSCMHAWVLLGSAYISMHASLFVLVFDRQWRGRPESTLGASGCLIGPKAVYTGREIAWPKEDTVAAWVSTDYGVRTLRSTSDRGEVASCSIYHLSEWPKAVPFWGLGKCRFPRSISPFSLLPTPISLLHTSSAWKNAHKINQTISLAKNILCSVKLSWSVRCISSVIKSDNLLSCESDRGYKIGLAKSQKSSRHLS